MIAVSLKRGALYWWCTCGASAAQPFCDGSHAQCGKLPLRFESTREETVFLCDCKLTRRPPFCDGSHATIALAGAEEELPGGDLSNGQRAEPFRGASPPK